MPPRAFKKRKRDDFIHNKSKNKEDVSFEYIKKQISKNIGKPVRIQISVDDPKGCNKSDDIRDLVSTTIPISNATCACCGESGAHPIRTKVKGHNCLEPTRDNNDCGGGALLVYINQDIRIPFDHYLGVKNERSDIVIPMGTHPFYYSELSRCRRRNPRNPYTLVEGSFYNQEEKQHTFGWYRKARSVALFIDFEREYYACEFSRCIFSSASELNIPFPLEIVRLCLSFLSSPF